MMEDEDKSVERTSSDFLVHTCRLVPKLHDAVSDRIHIPVPSSNRVPIMYAMICGSIEEFYIRPLNTCVDDIDALYYPVDKLAFVEDLPVLPNDVSGLADLIDCYKIV